MEQITNNNMTGEVIEDAQQFKIICEKNTSVP